MKLSVALVSLMAAAAMAQSSSSSSSSSTHASTMATATSKASSSMNTGAAGTMVSMSSSAVAPNPAMTTLPSYPPANLSVSGAVPLETAGSSSSGAKKQITISISGLVVAAAVGIHMM